MIGNKVFDVLEKKSKDYYALFISTKAQYPNNAQNLKHEFDLTDNQLEQVCKLPHNVSSEPYVRAFQYKVLNNILYTNTKLYRIGFTTDNLCSFCKLEPESLNHLLFYCIHSKCFWDYFEHYVYSLTNEFIAISLQDVLIGIITTVCPLLNYLLLIAKIYIWDCRRTQTLPNIKGFKSKVKVKYIRKIHMYQEQSTGQVSSIGDGGSGTFCVKNPTQKNCAKTPPRKKRFDWKIPRSNPKVKCQGQMPRSNPKVKSQGQMPRSNGKTEKKKYKILKNYLPQIFENFVI